MFIIISYCIKRVKNMASDFIKEKIKDKPVNKKKLFTKFITTVILAVVFGVVAALCYYYTLRGIRTVEGRDLQDVNEINIRTEEEGAPEMPASGAVSVDRSVSSDTVSDNDAEESPEDDEKQVSGRSEDYTRTVINNITNEVQMTPQSFERLYAALHQTAVEAEKALVTVTGSVSNTDWFDNTYENSSKGAGLIIDENGRELMILTNKDVTEGAETVSVTFCDGKTADARIVKTDSNTGLQTVGVELSDIDEETMDQITTAKLGNSSYDTLAGTPVIAIGNPLGIKGSETYGLVTSNTNEEQMTDFNAHLITTDIYGSSNASGVIINYNGRVLGIITDQYAEADTENMITAYSISDMKNVIERLANGRDEVYMGIYGIDVTEEAVAEYGVPKGAYVTGTIAGSPAMTAGIQSGDIIVKMGDTEITNFSDYTLALSTLKDEDEVSVTVQRFSRGGYQEMTFKAEVTITKK